MKALRNKYLVLLVIAYSALPMFGNMKLIPVILCAVLAPSHLLDGELLYLPFLLSYVPLVILFFVHTNHLKKIFEALTIAACLLTTCFVFALYVLAMFTGLSLGDAGKYFAFWAYPDLLAVGILGVLAFRTMLKIDETLEKGR